MAERIKVCGLWMNKSKDGVDYLTGKFSPTMKVLIFKNNYKQQGDNQPTHIMYFAPVETDQATQRGEGNDAFFGDGSNQSEENGEADEFTSAPARPQTPPQRSAERSATPSRSTAAQQTAPARAANPRPVQNTPPQRRAPQPAPQDDMGDFEDPFGE